MTAARAGVALAGVLSVAWFFRGTLASGFDLVPGDRTDARFLIAVLEHWRQVLLEGASMSSPPFFAPERGVLGHSESMVLFAPPYAAWRALGLDRYHAFAATLATVKALGFAGMYLALRRIVAVDRLAAGAGAALFTTSNASWLAAGHAQLMTVAFVPWLALLVHRWLRTHVAWPLAAAALLLALLLFTSFYVGWFTILVGALLLAVAAAAALAGAWGWRLRPAPAERRRMRRHLLVALALFALGCVPFLRVYLPALNKTGGRPPEEVVLYLARPSDVWNVGPRNRTWGRVLSPFVTGRDERFVFAAFEAERGWPPLTLAVFGVMLALAWRRVRAADGGREARRARLAGIAGTTAVLGWLLVQEIGGRSAWTAVYHLLPGATAIRVPIRVTHLLNVLVAAVVAVALARLGRGPRPARAAAWLLALGVVAEQWNNMPVARLSRATERALFASLQPPPAGCRRFYLAGNAEQGPPEVRNMRTQVDAMLVALRYRIPTVNGYSGNRPVGWNLDSAQPDYEQRVHAWAAARRIRQGLCRLDLRSGRWSLALAPPRTPQ